MADLEHEEAAAVASGDAAGAADRRHERVLLEEAIVMLQQRRDSRDHRLHVLAKLTERTPTTRGPKQMVTAREIADARQKLMDAGQDYGERSIAAKLGVSRDAVRYALGKDRRKSRN
jgi:hypothetical protein